MSCYARPDRTGLPMQRPTRFWYARPQVNAMKRIIISATVLLVAACAAPVPEPEPGMEVVGYGRDGEFQAAIGVDWSGYSGVLLETATVEFRENWVRDQKRYNDNIIRERDEVRIKTGTAELLGKVLARELSDAGYALADGNGPGVMRFTPRVADLDVVAPDRVSETIVDHLTDYQGSLTLELDIYDSVSGELLAITRQHQEDPYKGYMERTTSATNRRAFRLMMERWAGWLVEQIDSVHTRDSE
jgi:hypothetical protein